MDSTRVYSAARNFFISPCAATKKAEEKFLVNFAKSPAASSVCLDVLENVILDDTGVAVATLMSTTLRSRARKDRPCAEFVSRLLQIASRFGSLIPVMRNLASAIASGFLFQAAKDEVDQQIPFDTLFSEVRNGNVCALWVLAALPMEVRETHFGAPARLLRQSEFGKQAKQVLLVFNELSHGGCAILEAGHPWVEIADPVVLATTNLSQLLLLAHSLVGCEAVAEQFLEALINKTTAIPSEDDLFHQFLIALKPHLEIPAGSVGNEKRARLKLCLYALDASKRHKEMYQRLQETDHPASFHQVLRSISDWEDASLCLPTFRALTQAHGACPHALTVFSVLRAKSRAPDDAHALHMGPDNWEDFYAFLEDLRDFFRLAVGDQLGAFLEILSLKESTDDWRTLYEKLHALSAVAKRICQASPMHACVTEFLSSLSSGVHSIRPLWRQYLITASVLLPILTQTCLMDVMQCAVKSLQEPTFVPGNPWAFRCMQDHAGVVVLLKAAPQMAEHVHVAGELLHAILSQEHKLNDDSSKLVLTRVCAILASKDSSLSAELLRHVHRTLSLRHLACVVTYCGGNAPEVFPELCTVLSHPDADVMEFLSAMAEWPSLSQMLRRLLDTISGRPQAPMAQLCSTACILVKRDPTNKDAQAAATNLALAGLENIEKVIMANLQWAQCARLGGTWSEADLRVAFAVLSLVRQAQVDSLILPSLLLVTSILATEQYAMTFPNPVTELLGGIPAATLRDALRHVYCGEMLGVLLTRVLLKALMGNMPPASLGFIIPMCACLAQSKSAEKVCEFNDARFVDSDEFGRYLAGAVDLDEFPCASTTVVQKERFVRGVCACKRQQEFKQLLKRFCGGKKKGLSMSQ